MFHVLGFAASIAQNTEVLLTPVTDDVFQDQNDGFFYNDALEYFGGVVGGDNTSYAKIITPSGNCYGYNYVDQIVASSSGNLDGRVLAFREEQPLLLKGRELLQFQALQGGAGAEVNYAVALVRRNRTPVPSGEQFTIRATSTTACVANTWTTVSLTWPVNLPVGNYAVIGGDCISAAGFAWRLNAQNCEMRPGGFTKAAVDDPTIPELRFGGLGQWCTFDNNLMPQLQILSSTTTASHTLYLDCVKL